MFKSRFIVLLMALVIALTSFAPAAEAKKHSRSRKHAAVSRASGVNDPRYAALIMNPVTGEIYHQQDPDGRRYPASLTKMMTLYLLFEALDQHKIALDDRMEVSALAARQPQTNLSLDEGDHIDVETAIKALVVRSANDVAIVTAEALGGDIDNFAEKMTAKARALGMKNTVFKNPNGLPNNEQHTTARDMAKLGIALKRDFPHYYRYFSTLQFSHNGVTYYTHNRVMLRYAGVDGIKTGYIGNSGFNLVTSVVRGGRPLVGVVMGGTSGAWRDNRMIQLLDSTYQTIASRGAARTKPIPGNLPLPQKGGPQTLTIVDANDVPLNAPEKALPENGEAEDGAAAGEALPDATIPADRNAVRTTSPFEVAEKAAAAQKPAPVAVKPAAAPVVVTPVASTASRAKVIELAPTAPAQPAAAPAPAKPPETMVMQAPASAAAPVQLTNPPPPPVPVSAENGWGIQVGAFSTHELADQAARGAIQIAAKPLAAAHVAVIGPNGAGASVHRARIENISQVQARMACEQLIKSNSPCFIYKAVPDAK